MFQHTDAPLIAYPNSSQPVFLLTILGQELHMVFSTMKLQSPWSKHTFNEHQRYHCEDLSTVQVIVTLMKFPGFKSLWPAMCRSQGAECRWTTPHSWAISLKTLMLTWLATIFPPIGLHGPRQPYTHPFSHHGRCFYLCHQGGQVTFSFSCVKHHLQTFTSTTYLPQNYIHMLPMLLGLHLLIIHSQNILMMSFIMGWALAQFDNISLSRSVEVAKKTNYTIYTALVIENLVPFNCLTPAVSQILTRGDIKQTAYKENKTCTTIRSILKISSLNAGACSLCFRMGTIGMSMVGYQYN